MGIEHLTPRWHPMRAHEMQQRYRGDWTSRFKVVPAGRRSGKTEWAKRRLVRAALHAEHTEARFFAAAPTYAQAKRIYWKDLKRLVPSVLMAKRPSESELTISLVTGGEICVVGLDKPERIEGSPWDGGILDEFANMKPTAWTENVRPALADRGGWCDLIGVPEGRNHYFDLYERALVDETGEWAVYHWISADILSAEEIESARRDLDERTYRQEYGATFEDFAGRAYHEFERATHCAPLAYNPRAELGFCFDFNHSPGVAAVTQEQMLPSGEFGTGVIGEVWIPENSTTPAVCRRLAKDWHKHDGTIALYGDASGGAKGSARTEGPDWKLVKDTLRHEMPNHRFSQKWPNANPPVRGRINAMNSRLRSAAGDVRLMVDMKRAPHVVRDLEGVVLLEGGSGEIDKDKDKMLTHISDALGYMVYYNNPPVRNSLRTKDLVG